MLRDFSLVAVGIASDVFEIHRLVQFATRTWLERRQELERWKERYIAAIVEAFPSRAYKNWKRYQILFPHAVLALEDRPINEGVSPRWAGVFDKDTRYAAEQGSYQEAERMKRRTLDNRE